MELPENVGADLALIGDLTDAAFKVLALGVFKVLAGTKGEDAVMGTYHCTINKVYNNRDLTLDSGDAALADSDSAELKRAYAALTATVLEATRADLDEAGFV